MRLSLCNARGWRTLGVRRGGDGDWDGAESGGWARLGAARRADGEVIMTVSRAMAATRASREA